MIIVKPASINSFSPSPLSTSNFSLHNTYKIKHLVIRKWELIKQRKLYFSLVFSHLLEHKASVLSLHFSQMTASFLTSSHDFHPPPSLSFSTVSFSARWFLAFLFFFFLQEPMSELLHHCCMFLSFLSI